MTKRVEESENRMQFMTQLFSGNQHPFINLQKKQNGKAAFGFHQFECFLTFPMKYIICCGLIWVLVTDFLEEAPPLPPPT